MKRAFSLVELSIVLLIIGVVIVIFVQGSGLITSARLNSARSFTSKSPVPEISGLIVWYETSSKDSFLASETFDTKQLTEWRDISPSSIAKQKNKLTRVASSAITYQAKGINNFPSIKFNGGNFITASYYQGSSAQSTVFAVIRPSAVSSSQAVFLDAGTLASANAIGIRDTGVFLNSGTAITVATTFSVNQDYVVAVNFNGSSSLVFVNSATALSAPVNPGSLPSMGISIGLNRYSDPSLGFYGLISEIIVYNRPLKLQERKDVMRYLSKKYGIAVTGL
jgi:prepilin-type N-terminal cleavage/methylation domain-containing protein